MRKIALYLIIVALSIATLNKISFASDRIYIVETMLKEDIQTAKSRISLFKADGTKLNTITINGILARVSPDGKSIVYIERSNDSWDLTLADSTGKKIRNFKPKLDRLGNVAKLLWSPDGDKVAVLQHVFNREVTLNILFLKKNELKKIVSLPAQSSEDAYFYSVQWLQDSRAILIGGANGLKIIDITSTASEEIIKDSAVTAAHLINNDKKIFAVTTSRRENSYGMPEPGGTPKILLYDLQKKTSEEILSFERPSLTILSNDGRCVAFNYFGDPGFFILDTLNKKVIKKDTKGLMLIPKKFSPIDNNQIVCISGSRASDKTEYGIFNMERGEFKPLIESFPIHGESSMLLLMGFDWVDWR